ncbi:MAG: hypothetical protein PWP23_3234 [Candidatus Sumerlaeota bacterium]|nr:hypothetical protein [Candidatus Sumerlaeota bacterium]
MTPTPSPRVRRPRLPAFDGEFLTWEIAVPREEIKRVCNVFEAYDNMAVVRTPVAGMGVLLVYFWEGERAVVEAVLDSIAMEFPVERRKLHNGMHAADGLWNP